MSVLNKCNDPVCPIRFSCYRFTSPESVNQKWLGDSPREWGHCSAFILNGDNNRGSDNQEVINRLESEFYSLWTSVLKLERFLDTKK